MRFGQVILLALIGLLGGGFVPLSAWAQASPAPTASAASASVPRLVPVTACVQPQGETACTPIPLPAGPFLWDDERRDVSGQARFTWRVEGLAGLPANAALLLERAGNGYTVLLDGRTLAAVGAGPAAPWVDSGKQPWLVPLHGPSIQADSRLTVVLWASGGRAARLDPPRIGEWATLQAAWAQERFWRLELSRMLAGLAALIAGVCLLMGMLQRDLLFTSCGIAHLCWALRLLELVGVRMPLPWPEWGGVVATTLVGTQAAMTIYFLQAVGWWNVRWRHAAAAFAAVWLLVGPFVVASGVDGLWLAWLGLAAATLLAVNGWIGREALRQRRFWRWLFVAWWGLSGLAVALDILASPGSFYLYPEASRWVVAGFSLVLVALVARRLRRAHLADRARSRELRLALAEQQVRLRALHEAEARRDVERATWAERQRLMRDMHDGLGAQLYGLHALAGRPEAARRELQGQIRQAIEELRLVVDAMNPFDGDLAAMLGDLRPPLERRLALSQVELRWAVDELPAMPQFSPAKVQHLKRLLLEAATNVARHSGASEARLSARAQDQVLVLEFADNGRGFDPASPRAGNGLRNMRWRAMMLGAEFDIDAREGCRIRLKLPIPDPPPVPALPAALAAGAVEPDPEDSNPPIDAADSRPGLPRPARA